jgi:uncharacterized membrane protein HdeD (DUF308 family)
LRGLFALALGIFIFAKPLASVAIFALVIALWALFSGVTGIIHAIEVRSIQPHWWLRLLAGLISVAFGIWALYDYPVISLVFAVVWVAWWLMLTGVFEFAAALQDRKAGLPWGWAAVWGVISIVIGGVAFANPPNTLKAIMLLIAIFAIVSGVMLLIAAVRVRSTATEIAGAVRPAPA